MKILMPVSEGSFEGKIYQSFGRAPYFLIYDTKTKENNFIENHAANSQGGAGIKAAQTVVDQGVEALIVPQCGQNAANVIRAANIKMYKMNSNSIMDNINDFNAEKLNILNETHPGFHSRGGR